MGGQDLDTDTGSDCGFLVQNHTFSVLTFSCVFTSIFFFSFGVDFQHFGGKIYFHYAGGPSDVSNDYECGQNGRGRPKNQGL